MQNIAEALKQARVFLRTEGSSDLNPYLESSCLLALVLGWDRSYLFSRDDWPLSAEQADAFQKLLIQRAQGRPLAYLSGYKEFWGLNFKVDSRVLIPRPDTETLVEAALEISAQLPKQARVLDLCTGSGCIAVALAHSRPDWHIEASDISPAALELADTNSQRLLGRTIPLYHSNLLESVPGSYDLIVSNPPYLSSAETKHCLSQGWGEPESALDGGDQDGLGLIRRIISTAQQQLNPGAYLLLEAGSEQFPAILELFEIKGYTGLVLKADLAGRPRVAWGIATGDIIG